LIQLLDTLQHDMESRYGQAIRQLYQTSERLTRIKERSEEDYQLQLSLWKVDSRIQLHVARVSVSGRSRAAEIEGLETLLRERVLVRRQILEREREKLQARMDRVDASLDRLSDLDQAVSREMKAYRNLKPQPARGTPEGSPRGAARTKSTTSPDSPQAKPRTRN
jgi:hypothetical protein